MASVKIHNSFIPADNKITSDFNNKAYAVLPSGTSRVKSVPTEVAKVIKPLLKLDYGTLTPITYTNDLGDKTEYLARVEPHWHNLDGSQGLPLGAHRGISVFLSNNGSPDNTATKPDNEIPPSKKTDLLAKNDQDKSTKSDSEKSSFVNKLNNFLDKMLG